MQRFSFRLESVRALREQTQHQAEHELARQIALREQRRSDLESARRRVTAALDAGRAEAGQAAPSGELALHQAWVERIERDARAARAGLDAQEQKVVDGRARLVDASQQREALERLKQRRMTEHARELARGEEARLGEIGLRRFQQRAGDQAA